MVFSYSILFFGGFRKCAILPLDGKHRAGNFGQAHLRNIAGSCAQCVDGLQGIETADIAEILRLEVFGRIDAAANQQYIADAVLQQGLEDGFQRFPVQRLQEAAFLMIGQLCQIVKILLYMMK